MERVSSQDGPNESPFFAGLYFCFLASSNDGFSPAFGLQTSSLTAADPSARVV